MMTKFKLDEHFECFIDEFDTPLNINNVSDNTINKFHNKLPSRLLEYWKEYGFSGFNNGLFWLVNPDDYEDVLEAWIDNTEIVGQDTYYVIGRSAYGDLYIWGHKNGFKYILNPTRAWIIEQDGDKKEIDQGNDEHAIKMFFLYIKFRVY